MKQNIFPTFVNLLLSIITLFASNLIAQEQTEQSSNLPVQYEELTAPEFVQGVARSGGTCIIPIGILEKHGPHLPLGTDMLNIREIAIRAARQEYTIVYPQYYFGQIYEAKNQPGTIAYSPGLVWNLLQETCDELARNGLKKIILVNGHGGNDLFLPYFCQAQLEKRKDYAVLLFSPQSDSTVEEKVRKLRKTTTGGHGGETETSRMLAHRPDLAHVDRGKEQSGEDLNRLEHLAFTYTAIWWYAKYPNHYAGDGSQASVEIGELLSNSRADQLVEMLKLVKKDETIQELQQRFFDDSENPLNTKQR